MSIQSFNLVFPGQANDVTPRIGHLYDPNNTLSAITTAGYLNPYINALNIAVYASDVIVACGSNGTQWYKPVISSTGVITLTVLP